jgi:hypothetical protein
MLIPSHSAFCLLPSAFRPAATTLLYHAASALGSDTPLAHHISSMAMLPMVPTSEKGPMAKSAQQHVLSAAQPAVAAARASEEYKHLCRIREAADQGAVAAQKVALQTDNVIKEVSSSLENLTAYTSTAFMVASMCKKLGPKLTAGAEAIVAEAGKPWADGFEAIQVGWPNP